MKNLEKKKLILIQLNEINFDELKKYSKNYKFKFFNKEFFERLISTKSEEKYYLLEPWIQWPSIYTGLKADEHKILRLGDGEKKDFIEFYNIIENKGYSVGAIGPMNLKCNLKSPVYFIPDPWSKTDSDNRWINKFITKIIKKFVNENSSRNKSYADYLRLLLLFIIYFRFENLNLLFKLIKNINDHWNKALLFEYLLNNIHFKKIKKYNPDFTSIFFNSGAHIQHHYYFNSIFNNTIKNPEWYAKKTEDPIFEMFKFYDELLLEYNKNEKYDLILATGLRQIPYDRVKYYYRLKNHKIFLKNIFIKFKQVIPKMSRDFLIEFNTLEEAKSAEKILKDINILNNKNIFLIDLRQNSIFVTLSLNDEIKENYPIKINRDKYLNLSEFVNFIALKNGMHDQKGYFYSSFKNASLKDGQHVIKIFDVIKNYF